MFWFLGHKALWDLSSPARDRTCSPQHWKVNSQPLDFQEVHGFSDSYPVFSALSHFSYVWLFATPQTVARQASLNPTDGGPPGFSVRGILQARILEWVALPSSRGSFRPGD